MCCICLVQRLHRALTPCSSDMQHLHATFASNIYMQYFRMMLGGEKRGDFQLRSVHGLARRQAVLDVQARDAHACEVLAG